MVAILIRVYGHGELELNTKIKFTIRGRIIWPKLKIIYVKNLDILIIVIICTLLVLSFWNFIHIIEYMYVYTKDIGTIRSTIEWMRICCSKIWALWQKWYYHGAFVDNSLFLSVLSMLESWSLLLSYCYYNIILFQLLL